MTIKDLLTPLIKHEEKLNVYLIKEDKMVERTRIELYKEDLLKEIEKMVREAVGEDEKEEKHDKCTVDDGVWCYDHGESIEEGEYTTHTDRNILRNEIKNHLGIK